MDTKEPVLTLSLNPLGIGEGFEPKLIHKLGYTPSLNPLGIGEGFELLTC